MESLVRLVIFEEGRRVLSMTLFLLGIGWVWLLMCISEIILEGQLRYIQAANFALLLCRAPTKCHLISVGS